MWQKRLTLADQAALLSKVIVEGKTLPANEYPNADVIHGSLCTDFATIVAAACGGRVVAVDEACNIVIQGDKLAPDPERSVWRYVGTKEKARSQRRQLPMTACIFDMHGHMIGTVLTDLLKALHPGAIGLIAEHHGQDRAEEACEAVNAAKLYLVKAGFVP